MENCITSKPLYERIIVDRSSNKVLGFTFEDINDNQYQETYCFQKDPENASKTIYNAYLYKPPGYMKWMRQKAHNWGVGTMEGIMDKERSLKEELRKKSCKAKEIAAQKKEKLIEKKDAFKEKLRRSDSANKE